MTGKTLREKILDCIKYAGDIRPRDKQFLIDALNDQTLVASIDIRMEKGKQAGDVKLTTTFRFNPVWSETIPGLTDIAEILKPHISNAIAETIDKDIDRRIKEETEVV